MRNGASDSISIPFRNLPQVKPTHILNAAGLTGRPNVDWCEDHKVGPTSSTALILLPIQS